ncbi:MAG: hypothetical protein V1645_04365 [archaeon]
MELSDIVRDAACGLVVGFGVGASGACEKTGEMFTAAADNFSGKELRDLGVNDYILEKTRDFERHSKLTLPAITSMGYSLVTSVVTDALVLQSMVFSMPTAYIGRVVGSAARRFVSKRYGDMKVFESIKNDPENTLSYLPKKTRKLIDDSFGEVERIVLLGMDPKEEELVVKEGPLKRMADAIINDKKPYSLLLMKWTRDKFYDVLRQASLQKNIMDFYEKVPEGVNIGILGDARNTNLKIFEVDDKSLKTYTASFKVFKVASNDPSTPKIEIESSPAEIKIVKSEDWGKDYKRLATEIMKSQDGYTTMIIKSLPGMPNGFRTMIVTESFMAAHADYQKEKAYFSRYTA